RPRPGARLVRRTGSGGRRGVDRALRRPVGGGIRRGAHPHDRRRRRPRRARGQTRGPAGRRGAGKSVTATVGAEAQGGTGMSPSIAIAIAAIPAFVASVVEFVEAFTIVL